MKIAFTTYCKAYYTAKLDVPDNLIDQNDHSQLVEYINDNIDKVDFVSDSGDNNLDLKWLEDEELSVEDFENSYYEIIGEQFTDQIRLILYIEFISNFMGFSKV